MRRTIARGRLFPQSYSTDRRIGRLSLKAWGLFPLIWVNGDDQGRLSGDPEEVKYTCCPNIDHITKADIPELLKELEQNKLIKVYPTPKSAAIQLLDWWNVQKLQWAYPSDYPAPDDWQDKLRYKKGREQVITFNWGSGESSGESSPDSPLSPTGESSGELGESPPLPTPILKRKRKTKEEGGRGRGNSPDGSGEKAPSPPLTVSPVKLFNKLIECYRIQWGRVPAASPNEVIPREPDARITAQLRDLTDELSHAGGCPLEYIEQAFREAAGQQKYKVSYVRAILLDWLGIERNRSP